MPQKHRGLRGRAFALGAILLGSSALVTAAPFAYVPNSGLSGSGPSTVSVIDTATNTVIRTITVGPRPRTVSVSPTQVFIANQGEPSPSDTGSVSVISIATNTVTATIPVEAAFGIASFGDRLYVSGFTNAVSVISLASNSVIATIPIPGGIPSAGVGAEPLGVVVAPSGARVYTSNFIDKSVSVIDTASLSIVATVRLTDQPQAIAIDPSGSRVYTANLNSVSVIDTATNSLVMHIPASLANGLAWPQALAVDPSGTSLYVTNSIAGTVSVFSTATLSPTAVVSISGSPQGISFTPDGSKAYVADKDQDLVHAISTASNTLIASIPVGVTPISIGNFIVPGDSCATPPSVTVSTLAGSPGLYGSTDGTGSSARFNFPDQLAVDSAGNIYVADTSNSTIRKVTPAGVVTTFAGLAGAHGYADGTGSSARFFFPSGISVDSAGNLYVGDNFNAVIRKITPAGVVSTLAGSPGNAGSADGTGSSARFSSPRGTAVDSAGNVYVAEYTNAIRKITPAGVVTTLAGLQNASGSADGTGSAARFSLPIGIAVDTLGYVYVADNLNNTIRKITPAGVVTTLAGLAGASGSQNGTGSSARFSSPTGVATDAAGNVYVVDRSNNMIRKIDPFGVVTTVAGFPLPSSAGTEDGPVTVARFNGPSGVAVDSSGNLYIADSSSATIRKIAISPGCPCAGLTVRPSFLSYPASGGPRTLAITAPATCRWTLSHTAGWLTPGSATGTGSGAVVLTASAVVSGQLRRANVTVSGNGEARLVRVTQGDLIIDPVPAKTAMTWAKIDHDNTWGIDRVNCTSSTMACNPYTGDTSCSNSLPVLCVSPQGLPRPPYTPDPSLFYDGWVGGSLALTAPVLGTSLTSQATADALCATTFGSGWRMAEFHDGGGGWGFRAYGNIPDGGSRFWVRISDQPANCW
jgi:YVTN family beta-propeller protein